MKYPYYVKYDRSARYELVSLSHRGHEMAVKTRTISETASSPPSAT